jgi:hypothetical protein
MEGVMQFVITTFTPDHFQDTTCLYFYHTYAVDTEVTVLCLFKHTYGTLMISYSKVPNFWQ